MLFLSKVWNLSILLILRNHIYEKIEFFIFFLNNLLKIKKKIDVIRMQS